MKVRTYGQNGKVSRKEMRYATRFMSGLLMSAQLRKYLHIHLHFNENNGTHKGWTIWLDDSACPREFKIAIDPKTGRRTQLMTLAHELVHVRQFAKNEMKSTMQGRSTVTWKKERIDEEKVGYYFLPWELEARGYEEALYEEYQKHLRANKITFD